MGRMLRFVWGVTVALITASTANANFIVDDGQIPGGQGENLLGNTSDLISVGSLIQGYTNQTKALLDISSVGFVFQLSISGGQAVITEASDAPQNPTTFGNVTFAAHTGAAPAGYSSMYWFNRIEFNLGYEFPGGTSDGDGGDLTFEVEYLDAGNVSQTFTSTVFPQPQQPPEFRWHIQALDGERITKVTVLTTSSFLNEIKQVRLDGVNTTGTIDGQGDIVPEPTSLALAGFAGIGMAVGAIRRRRQSKAAAA